jgi:hypothetical protein
MTFLLIVIPFYFLFEHYLLGKPVPIPDQVRDRAFRITLGDRQAANYASAELEKKFPDGVALFPRLMLAAVVREKSEQQLFRAARSATSDGLNRMLPD